MSSSGHLDQDRWLNIRRDVATVTTADEATQIAIDWQHWADEQNLSYGELADWAGYFSELAEKFDLTAEFQENGII